MNKVKVTMGCDCNDNRLKISRIEVYGYTTYIYNDGSVCNDWSGVNAYWEENFITFPDVGQSLEYPIEGCDIFNTNGDSALYSPYTIHCIMPSGRFLVTDGQGDEILMLSDFDKYKIIKPKPITAKEILNKLKDAEKFGGLFCIKVKELIEEIKARGVEGGEV